MFRRYTVFVSGFVAAVLVAGLRVNAAPTDPAVTGHSTTFDNAAPAVCDPDGLPEKCNPPAGIAFKNSGDATCEGSQWTYVDANRNAVIEGQVTYSKLATDDSPFNHDSRDRNFFIYPDRSYQGMLAKPGNFETGEPNEHGRLEVEWESAAMPEWVLPMQGDWVHVQGNYIFDCAHPQYRTEIHPPRLIMTIRDAAQDPWTGSSNRTNLVAPPNEVIGPRPGWADTMPEFGSIPVPTTRADIYASSDGGGACGVLHCLNSHSKNAGYQPLNDSNYDLFVPAPPKPDGDYQMIWTVTRRPLPGCFTDGASCGMDDILLNHPERVQFSEDTQMGKPGLKIHVDFSGYTADENHELYGFGFTTKVAWNKPADSPPRRVRVILDKIYVANPMDGGGAPFHEFADGEFALSAMIGDQFKHLQLTGGNGEVTYNNHQLVPYSEDVNNYLYDVKSSGNECGLGGHGNPNPANCQNSFEVTLLPGQPLRIFLRGDEWEPFATVSLLHRGDCYEIPPPLKDCAVDNATNKEVGVVEHTFTEAENYGIGSHSEWFQERTSAGDDSINGYCSPPNGPCVKLDYRIQDDPYRLLSVVCVDRANNSGIEDGTAAHPYNTVLEGSDVADSGATVFIQAGGYPETLHLSRPVTIIATGGEVSIGK